MVVTEFLHKYVDWLVAITLLVGTLAAFAALFPIFASLQIRKRELKQIEFNNYFSTLDRINNKDGVFIRQIAAVFEIRNHMRYKDLSMRICNNKDKFFPNVTPEDNLLMKEFDLTSAYLKKCWIGRQRDRLK